MFLPGFNVFRVCASKLPNIGDLIKSIKVYAEEIQARTPVGEAAEPVILTTPRPVLTANPLTPET